MQRAQVSLYQIGANELLQVIPDNPHIGDTHECDHLRGCKDLSRSQSWQSASGHLVVTSPGQSEASIMEMDQSEAMCEVRPGVLMTPLSTSQHLSICRHRTATGGNEPICHLDKTHIFQSRTMTMNYFMTASRIEHLWVMNDMTWPVSIQGLNSLINTALTIGNICGKNQANMLAIKPKV